jgi:hypothetical protein
VRHGQLGRHAQRVQRQEGAVAQPLDRVRLGAQLLRRRRMGVRVVVVVGGGAAGAPPPRIQRPASPQAPRCRAAAAAARRPLLPRPLQARPRPRPAPAPPHLAREEAVADDLRDAPGGQQRQQVQLEAQPARQLQHLDGARGGGPRRQVHQAPHHPQPRRHLRGCAQRRRGGRGAGCRQLPGAAAARAARALLHAGPPVIMTGERTTPSALCTTSITAAVWASFSGTSTACAAAAAAAAAVRPLAPMQGAGSGPPGPAACRPTCHMSAVDPPSTSTTR